MYEEEDPLYHIWEQIDYDIQDEASVLLKTIRESENWLNTAAKSIWHYNVDLSGYFEHKQFDHGTYEIFKTYMMRQIHNKVMDLFSKSFARFYKTPDKPDIEGLKKLLVDIKAERDLRAEASIGLKNKGKNSDLDLFEKVVNKEIEKCRKNSGLVDNPTKEEVEQNVRLFIMENQKDNVFEYIRNHPMPSEYGKTQARYINESYLNWKEEWKRKILHYFNVENLNWDEIKILKKETFKTYFMELKRK